MLPSKRAWPVKSSTTTLPVYVVALQKVYAVCLLSKIAYLLYYMYHHKEQLVHLTIIIDTCATV